MVKDCNSCDCSIIVHRTEERKYVKKTFACSYTKAVHLMVAVKSLPPAKKPKSSISIQTLVTQDASPLKFLHHFFQLDPFKNLNGAGK
jgi:hypothetical protein